MPEGNNNFINFFIIYLSMIKLLKKKEVKLIVFLNYDIYRDKIKMNFVLVV